MSSPSSSRSLPCPHTDALILTGRAPVSFFRNGSEQTMHAAAPSPTGAHMARVRGQATSLSASTSSTDISCWYCDSGLRDPWKWFFEQITASCRCVLPNRFMCQRAPMA